MTDAPSPRVHRLPAGVIAKIAAGEMIERPVSVLKELVENALDAGATRITVQVDGALDRGLSVIDDGVGMTREEVTLAVERHATSKIHEAEDLFRLRTLGFRGEALAAIGAVSALTIVTRAREGGEATLLEIVGGKLLGIQDASRTQGTTVDVRDLFFNVPVRRKFMKTERGELRAGMRLISHTALANPSIRFTYERLETSSLVYEATPDLRTRAMDVYGRATAEQMLEVSHELRGVGVTGLVGRPEQSRATRDFQVMVVNGRPVVSPLLNHAVKMGFKDLIAPDRHPMSVLHLTLPPADLDVNVHPTKREVKFAHEGTVFEAVRDAVLAATAELAPRRSAFTAPGTAPGTPGESGLAPATQLRIGESDAGREAWAPPGERLPEAPILSPAPSPEGRVEASTPAPADTKTDDASRPGSGAGIPTMPGAGPADVVTTPGRVARPDEPKFWQLHRRYIFAQTGSGVIIIDQHAAHERIHYERALARLDGEPAATQQLVIPETLELTPSEAELVEELTPRLRQLGFEIERFGPRSVLVRGIPEDIHAWGEGQLLRDLLDEYVHAGRSVRAVRERLARAFACRAAVKSGRSLAPEEMRALIDTLFATSMPHGDPHGRPTLIQMSLEELDRKFGRA